MNKIKRAGLFLLTVLAVAIFLIATYYILILIGIVVSTGLSRSELYISLMIGLCFFITLVKLYRYLFRKKFGINLNADIIFVFAAPSVFWLLIPILGAVLFFYLHFIALAVYLMADILIWGIRTYIERREIREYVKNMKKE